MIVYTDFFQQTDPYYLSLYACGGWTTVGAALDSLHTAVANAGAGNLATVATSGSYTDLINKPALFSGDYNDLTGKPALFSGAYGDLSDKPAIPAAPVAMTATTDSNGAFSVSWPAEFAAAPVVTVSAVIDATAVVALMGAPSTTGVSGSVVQLSDGTAVAGVVVHVIAVG